MKINHLSTSSSSSASPSPASSPSFSSLANIFSSQQQQQKRKHIHSKYVTAQEVANMVVLQPPVQEKVLPLLLIDLRSYEEYCSAHIEWSISMQIPDKLIDTPEQELIQLLSTVVSEDSNSSSPHASPRKRRGSDCTPPRPNVRHARSRSSSSVQTGIPLNINTDIAAENNNNTTTTTTTSATNTTKLPSSPRSASSVYPPSPRALFTADSTAEAVLTMLETTCFQEKVFEHKFHWRHLSHAVLFIDCDDSNSDSEQEVLKKKKCRWLYRLLKREHKIKALSILNCSFSEFQRTLPFLITNKRHKEFDFPTIINSYMFLGSFRLLGQPGGIDVVLKKKLGVQYILNCAKECPDVIPEKYFQTNQFSYTRLELESETDLTTPVSEQLSFEKVREIISFIEHARRHNKSLVTGTSTPTTITQSSISTPTSSDGSPVESSPIRSRKLSLGRQEHARVLIICHEGRCRGIVVCIIYFMIRFCWTLDTCLQFFKVHRPLVNIDEHYFKYLEKLEALMTSLAENRGNDLTLSTRLTEVENRWLNYIQ
jgi:hypothetical protein